MEHPKITIITPSYNQGQYLEETIKSVLDQNYPNLEFFIMDGGSTDNSVEVIRKYESRITGWVSEKDRGQTHAINKGLALATGDIINWINSDDLLAPGSLQEVAETFAMTKAHCICGSVTIFDSQKSWAYPPAYEQGESLQEVVGRDTYNQPGTFLSRDAVNKMGPPDESLRYIMDKEWFVRFLLNFGTEHIVVTPEVLALHRYHDTSKTIAEGQKFYDEYAALVWSMAEALGLNQYRDLLAEKYSFESHPYRFSYSMPTLAEGMIHQMVAVLLLRRYYRIWNKSDFLFARRMLEIIPYQELKLETILEENYRNLEKCTQFGSWFIFKARRKLGLVKG